MKPTNSTLNAILASREFMTADLYQITLNNSAGTVLYYCSGQIDITYNGHVYYAGGQIGPYFDRRDARAKVSWRLGPGNDSLVIAVAPGSATVINGISFLNAARIGMFDGADFLLNRAFMTVYGTVSAGCAPVLFRGRIAEIDVDRAVVVFTVNDYRELLNQQLPRNLFSASCVNTLGDASCTVALASFSATTSVVDASPTQVHATLAQATGYFDNGKILFTSGSLNTMTLGISQYFNGTPSLILPVSPFPIVPTAGDTFTVYAGCDRTLGAGGCAKFTNTANFRGFPYVPPPEAAL